MEEPVQLPEATEEPVKQKKAYLEVVEIIAIAVALAVIIRLLLFQPFYIPSGSMEPTLLINDVILVSKVNYWFSEPQRGDIIVFKYPDDPGRDFVKRVIGVGGDQVQVKAGKVYVNGEALQEPYIKEEPLYDFGPVEVPAGHYFMLGDNRNNSQDSRYWVNKFVSRDQVIGKVVLRYWPLERISAVGMGF